MPIYGLIIACENPQSKNTVLLHTDLELSDVPRLQKGQMEKVFTFLVRQSLPCLDIYSRNTVMHQQNKCYIQMASKPVAAYAFTDGKYSERVIFVLLKQVLQLFFESQGDKWKEYGKDCNLKLPQITEKFEQFQHPEKVDKLQEAIKHSEQTKVHLHESIKKLLENQGDLDQLVKRSKDLSYGAKSFYATTQELNSSCCSLI